MPPHTIIPTSESLGAATFAQATPRTQDLETDASFSGLAGAPSVPWWLWPHLLSLDAPLVALIWQRWWAHWGGVRLMWREEAILGLGVWMIYVGDRLADTAPRASADHRTARHRFYHGQRRNMMPVAAAVFFALAWFTPWLLPVEEFFAGLGLLALAGGYFWLIHRRTRRGWSHILPKEAAVGGMFAAGSAFFVLGRMTSFAPAWMLAVPLFGALCFCNCALITRWEENPLDLRDASSLLNAFPGMTAHLAGICLCIALIALAGAVIFPAGGVLAPIGVSALLLAALDHRRNLLSTDGLRVLADVALLTPLLGFLVSSRCL